MQRVLSTAIVLLTSITFPWTLEQQFQSSVLNLRLKKFFRMIVQPHPNFAKRFDFEDRIIQQTWKWPDNDLRRDARFHERSIKNREKKLWWKLREGRGEENTRVASFEREKEGVTREVSRKKRSKKEREREVRGGGLFFLPHPQGVTNWTRVRIEGVKVMPH